MRGGVDVEGEYVLIIGGAAMDITGIPYGPLQMEDSNPGMLQKSLGGVGRNIGENLVRLGVGVKVITALGDDDDGREIAVAGEKLGMDFSHTLVLPDESTACYLAVLDEARDMRVAIASMDIFRRLSADFLASKAEVIRRAAVIVLDANLEPDTLAYMAQEFGDRPLFVDMVSANKCVRLRPLLGSFHTVKPNKLEAAQLSGLSIHEPGDLPKLTAWFVARGVQRVFISLGSEGLYCGSREGYQHVGAQVVPLISATGAGDACMAGLVYGHLQGLSVADTANFAQAMAALTLGVPTAIHPQMSVTLVRDFLSGTRPLIGREL